MTITFIKFTKTDGEEVHVRPYSVTAIAQKSAGVTEIVLLGGAYFLVKESVQTVIEDVQE